MTVEVGSEMQKLFGDRGIRLRERIPVIKWNDVRKEKTRSVDLENKQPSVLQRLGFYVLTFLRSIINPAMIDDRK